MNAQQAKRIPLTDILARLGFEPHHVDKWGIWYNSPFRAETKPSFKVNPDLNTFYDFAGVGGNVLDFVMQFYQVADVSAALARLDDLMGVSPSVKAAPSSSLPLFAAVAAPPAAAGNAAGTVEIKKVQALQNKALVQYLCKRGIDAAVARVYLKEAYYTYNGKHYFALAFENRSGGFELRNPYWKSAHGSKDISVLPPHGAAGDGAGGATIFEGFMDFLSAFSYPETEIANMTAIVLNSTALKQKALDAVRQIGARTVYLYLDHDESGRTLTAAFQRELQGVRVVDRASLYVGHKDLNAHLEAALAWERC